MKSISNSRLIRYHLMLPLLLKLVILLLVLFILLLDYGLLTQVLPLICLVIRISYLILVIQSLFKPLIQLVDLLLQLKELTKPPFLLLIYNLSFMFLSILTILLLLVNSLMLSFYVILQDQSMGWMIRVEHESQGLYYFTSTISLAAYNTIPPNLAHSRLGRPCLSKLQKMVPFLSALKSLDCESCQTWKTNWVFVSQSYQQMS